MKGLDAYITGNYGEDQFKPQITAAFTNGMVARRDGLPMSACPYNKPRLRQDWIAGWRDEDVSLRRESAEEDGPEVDYEAYRNGEIV